VGATLNPSATAEKLGERYAIYGEIASGGMATVHFARLVGPVGFTRTVAVKRLHSNLRAQPEFVRMFLDEARLAARVRHPNVVATIDVVETEDQICLVMEYVHGESLRRLARRAMAQGGRVPRRIAAAIMVGSLHGLHAAHEAKNEQGEPLGLVHRDVSPHNIILGADGIPRVIDFGIAKARGQLRETSAGNIKGKFAYMAPEQLAGGNVTRAADIYSASVVLWELLTGRRLFESKMDASLLERATVKIDRPSSIVPSLTPALDGLVLRGLAGDPDQRFSSARAMARAIEDCIAPASTADVGEWVERMAKDRLDLREAMLNEIEGRGSAPVPDLVLPAAAARGRTPSDPSSLYATHTPSTSAVVPAPRAQPDLESSLDSDDADARASPIELDDNPLAGHRPISSRARPIVGRRMEAKPPRRFPWGVLWFALLVVLGGGAAAVVFEAPSYVKKHVAQASAQGGLSLSVGEVVFRPNALILTANHVEPLHLEGVTVGVGDVEVALHGITPGDVLVRGFDVTARGALGDVMANLSRWATGQSAALLFDARSGHLVWTDPFGKGTVLEAWDTTVTSTPHALTVSSPSVMIRTPRSKLGPWSVRIERGDAASSLAVSFDPSAATPALTLTWGGAQSSAVLDLPRAPLSRLGIPSGALGDVEVSGRSSLIKTADGKAEGQLALSFFGLRTDGGSEVSMTARLQGDALSSLALADGQIASAGARIPVSGTLAVLDSGVRLDLSMKGPGGGRGGLPASVVFDSRDLGGRP
jgi:serine/threonine protein kinase